MSEINYKEELLKLNARRSELQDLYSDQLQKQFSQKLQIYVGKYFKYENSYSSNDKWFEYYEVIQIVPDSIWALDEKEGVKFRCISKKFCQMPDGEIRVNMNEDISSNLLQKEIHEEEFNEAMADILQSLRS